MVAPAGREPAKDGYEVRAQEVLLHLRVGFEDVKPDRESFVRRIEQYHLCGARLRNAAEHLVHKVAVGIEHAHAIAIIHVLDDHIEEQG